MIKEKEKKEKLENDKKEKEANEVGKQMRKVKEEN